MKLNRYIRYGEDYKAHLLTLVTGLVVAHVRWYLQYDVFPWDSISQFLIAWVAHYLAVWVAVFASYAVAISTVRYFLQGKELSPDESLVYFTLCILVCAVLVFLVALLGPDMPHDIGREIGLF